jgi:hypothetical protein
MTSRTIALRFISSAVTHVKFLTAVQTEFTNFCAAHAALPQLAQAQSIRIFINRRPAHLCLFYYLSIHSCTFSDKW